MKKIRILLFLFGNVQGVGLRKKILEKRNKDFKTIAGFAKNLPPPDRNVEIALEGDYGNIICFEKWIGELEGVKQTKVIRENYTGEFTDFEIR